MHDFCRSHIANIWEQLWEVSAQKTNLFKNNEFLSACTHQKATKTATSALFKGDT
jgi:hypothetical protein